MTPGTRVLHVLGELRPSGMERMLVSGASGFDSAGVEGHVFGVGRNHPFERAIRDAGYSVHTTDSALHTPAGRQVLHRLLAEVDPHVVHIHTEGRYLQTVLAVRRSNRRMPVVRTIHNVFDARGRWFLRRAAQALIADRLVDALIAPSPDVAANEARFGRRVRVIYNWVEDRFFEIAAQRAQASVPSTAPIVIVGNCSKIKSHEVVLEAALLGNLSVVHVGSEDDVAPAERELLERLDQVGLLAGRGVGDPAAALLAGRVFAMPSRHEGMPVALAEALVVGLPAVVSDVPGLRWAAGQGSVVALGSREPAEWTERLRESAGAGSAPTIDFRAARGTSEYAEVYRAVTTRRRRSAQ
ncbi:glycosyltransferase [Curtobacterium sp. KBS0715]|uniref:glycosyltransferase n=1 Tax=Curtobacterium sp. KBS0715 TaxID=1179671 RepID=UPI00163DB847|nr:glycosyltransferase [Curtobacterium sp. KBS0715]